MSKDITKDVKNDPTPEKEDTELDFGNDIGDDAEGAEDDADKGDDNADAEDGGKAGDKAGKEAGEEGEEGEGADDADGAGNGDADGEDGKEDTRAKGLEARAGGKPAMVPSFRLRQTQAQVDKAEAKVAELSAKLAELTGGGKKDDPVKAIGTELDTLYEQVEEARAEGRTKDAARLQRQIDSKNLEVAEIRTSRIATQQALRAAETSAYDATVAEIETKFPELNPDNEALFDSDLAEEVLDLRDGFMKAKGMTAKEAIKKALGYVFKEEVLATGTAHLYKKDAKKEGKAPDKAVEKAAERKAEGVKKAVDANARQPARSSDSGKADGKGEQYNVKAMSEKDWDALPESTLARLRGDFIGS